MCVCWQAAVSGFCIDWRWRLALATGAGARRVPAAVTKPLTHIRLQDPILTSGLRSGHACRWQPTWRHVCSSPPTTLPLGLPHTHVCTATVPLGRRRPGCWLGPPQPRGRRGRFAGGPGAAGVQGGRPGRYAGVVCVYDCCVCVYVRVCAGACSVNGAACAVFGITRGCRVRGWVRIS